jgi:transcriptional regulator with XRE-family HTH domain
MRAWREGHSLTQDDLGSLLGITREWIGKLETGRRPISAEIFLRFEALQREPKFSQSAPPAPLHDPAIVPVFPGDPAAAEIIGEIRDWFECLLIAAGDDRNRLGWISEQLRAHVTPPPHWRDELSPVSADPNVLSPLHAQVEREVLAKMRRKEREEEQRAKFVQSSASKEQGGAGR